MTEQALQAEIVRLNKVVQALMDHAERGEQGSAYNLFQTTIMLEDQVRHRTEELQAALHENERITRALRESEEKFRALVDQSLVGITLTDGEHFVYANPCFAAMTGYRVDELIQMSLLDITPEIDRPRASELIRKRMTDIHRREGFVVNVLCKSGALMNAEISGASIHIAGKVLLMSVWLDVTERLRIEREVQALNQALREQAIRDPLTGLFNRRHLKETLDRQLQSARAEGFEVSLIMGDIDHFKRVNDSYGHLAGDQVLRTFGELVARHSRPDDIGCRYGGEEFLLVLPKVSLETACLRAEQLRLAVESASVRCDAMEIRVTASFGVASYPAHGRESASLVAAADAAMYAAKEAGRNRVQCAPDAILASEGGA